MLQRLTFPPMGGSKMYLNPRSSCTAQVKLQGGHALYTGNGGCIRRWGTSYGTSLPRECPLPSVLLSDEHYVYALSSHWPRKQKYAFPLVKIMSLVLHKVWEEREILLLIELKWPNQPWFLEPVYLLVAPPWPIPLRRDLLSQARRTI